MKCQTLITQCRCGGIVPPTLLWVSEDNALIAEGICLACSAKVSARSPFSQLHEIARDLRGERKPIVPPLNNDKQFLHDVGISDE